MSIKSKLVISYLLLIVFSVSLFGVLIANKSQQAVFKEATEKSERITELATNMVSVKNNLLSKKVWSDLFYAKKQLNNFGTINLDYDKTVQFDNYLLPSLYAGNTNLTIDNTLVDGIKESLSALCSILIFKDNKLIRMSTNLILNGNRAVGTYISNDSPIYKNLINNKPYYNNNLFFGDRYITGYEPIIDENGVVIGALALGYKCLDDFLKTTLSDIKIGETGYIYVMDSKGKLIQHPGWTDKKIQNIGKFDFSKEIINNKNGIIDYELFGVHKIATYRYVEEWDWYIVATCNYSDLKSSSKAFINMTFLIALIIVFIGIIISLFIANSLVKPINKLKKYMEIAGSGDLNVHCDIKKKDEIGVLSDSFNNMIKENKQLMEKIIKHDQLKTDFFSNLSHEFKTPINIIFSSTQLLSLYSENDTEVLDSVKLDKHIKLIKQNCYRLLKLVNNLIDISKIDSGFMEYKPLNSNIVQIVENSTLSTVEYVESKNRALIFDTDIEEKIMAVDIEMIERMLLNLISNAVKFTKPNDNIYVNIYDKKESILISVKDTGIGIPEEKQQEIFERFKQVDPLLNRNHEGSGIGLSIVKSLVEMHNGKISLNSTYGEGTEFIIELPVKLISEKDNTKKDMNFTQQTNTEKIKIEFSDIYS